MRYKCVSHHIVHTTKHTAALSFRFMRRNPYRSVQVPGAVIVPGPLQGSRADIAPNIKGGWWQQLTKLCPSAKVESEAVLEPVLAENAPWALPISGVQLACTARVAARATARFKPMSHRSWMDRHAPPYAPPSKSG